MTFQIDPRLEVNNHCLIDWPLSKVYLKNDRTYPWMLLVPRVAEVSEIYQLTSEQQQQLMAEINRLSLLMKACFQPQKLNVAAMGNVVSQLHVHLVGRFYEDECMPFSVWQPAYQQSLYSEGDFAKLIAEVGGHPLLVWP